MPVTRDPPPGFCLMLGAEREAEEPHTRKQEREAWSLEPGSRRKQEGEGVEPHAGQ